MDWIGVALSLTGWYLMPKKRRIAIIVFLIAGIAWVTWSILTKTWSILFIQLCYAVLNVRTLVIWSRKQA